MCVSYVSCYVFHLLYSSNYSRHTFPYKAFSNYQYSSLDTAFPIQNCKSSCFALFQISPSRLRLTAHFSCSILATALTICLITGHCSPIHNQFLLPVWGRGRSPSLEAVDTSAQDFTPSSCSSFTTVRLHVSFLLTSGAQVRAVRGILFPLHP